MTVETALCAVLGALDTALCTVETTVCTGEAELAPDPLDCDGCATVTVVEDATPELDAVGAEPPALGVGREAGGELCDDGVLGAEWVLGAAAGRPDPVARGADVAAAGIATVLCALACRGPEARPTRTTRPEWRTAARALTGCDLAAGACATAAG